jgi:alkyl sulfatase BDS1-like metallo-beta-lactamase superfamily hydrolase
MIKNIFSKITLALLTSATLFNSCSDSHKVSFEQKISSPDDLHNHSKTFEKRIEKVGDNIYVAIGYGLANSILIEGKDSTIIVDCMESTAAGLEVRAAFDSVCNKPLAALIYTHFHSDHTNGAMAIAGKDKPAVYAQEQLPHYLDQTAAVVRDITEKRAYRMFGVFLDDEALVNAGIGPFLHVEEGSTIGPLRPTHVFEDSLEATVAGIHFILYHAPGETNDQLFVWLPESKTLLPGDNLYKTFPNLYTIRGTAYRDVNDWRNSLDKMRFMHPEIIVPSHTEPIIGEEKINKILTDYRDAIQFIHDQTVFWMNKGLTPDELIEKVILPKHLQESEYLQEFYGTTAWSVRSVFSGYLGWFDGNPTTLNPLKLKDRATKIEKLAGGKDNLITVIDEALANNENQWALELSEHLKRLYPEDEKVNEQRIQALVKLGEAQSNPNARHYYLTCALGLQGKEGHGLIVPTSDFVNDIPSAAIFNGMAVKLNAERSVNVNKKALFHFTDTDEYWTVEVRKGVAEVQPFNTGNPDFTMHVKSYIYKELGAKIRSQAKTLLTGEIEIEGSQIEFVKFMGLFDID